jgi:hypothetical protein
MGLSPPSPPSPPFFGLPQPWAITSWYQPAGFNQAAQTWADSGVQGSWAATLSGVTAVATQANTLGSSCSFTALQGAASSSISFPFAIVSQPYSMCAMVRYTDAVNQRILQSQSANWYLGGSGGLTGQSNFGANITLGTTALVTPVDNWVYTCAAVPTSGAIRVFVNGKDQSLGTVVSAAGVVPPGLLGINLGTYATGSYASWRSAFAITELLYW